MTARIPRGLAAARARHIPARQREPLPAGVTVTPELLEAVARAVAAVLVPQLPRPVAADPEEVADFLTARQFARRLGISHETVRRLAIAGELPCTMVCRSSTKTTCRYPRRFAEEFAASGLDVADLAEFTTRWRAAHGERVMTAHRAPGSNRAGHLCTCEDHSACTSAVAKFRGEHPPRWFQ